jgi:hypothetical protein
MEHSDYPVGAVPDLIRFGAGACICTRFKVDAAFALDFVKVLGEHLNAQGHKIREAFSSSLRKMEEQGADRWRDLACLELIVRPK